MQNNSIRYPLEKMGPQYGQMYRKMAEASREGLTIGFQCAAMKRVGDLGKTFQIAVDLGASYVEAPGGYEKKLTRAELESFDAALRGVKAKEE
ncbi:MAG: hypothetical protein NTW86_17980 [Candidatus Sumerlaeota bacterium]|nr:hypothetical protein [Candidatus Sumerlaeota bacterium]